MLQVGNFQTLTINRVTNNGIYLADEDGEEVLLPNRYVSIDDKVGQTKEVFIYHDSENRLIATTEQPWIKAGEAAYLEVVDKNVHGVFLNWGITSKDLFVPNTNQSYRMEVGKKYVVFAYIDNVTGRMVGTTKLNKFVSNEDLQLRPKQAVNILVAQRLESGYRVVIENRHWGMIYDNQIFRPIKLGERVTAYVRRITEDNRVDLSLQQQGFDEIKVSADKLLNLLKNSGGRLDICDDSSPEEVTRVTQMSKKVFKRSLGYLLSHGLIAVVEGGIELKGKGKE